MTLEPRNTGAGVVERVARAWASFRSGRTRPVSWRRSQLEALKRLLTKEESAIFEALWADLRKPRLEGHLTEVGFVIAEIDDTLQHLDRWMKPERTHTSLLSFSSHRLRQRHPWRPPPPAGRCRGSPRGSGRH